MRIPPYYRQASWQRFFAGMAIGGVISWCIFLYIFGEWQEEYSMKIEKQEEDIRDLKNEKKIWQEDYNEINKKNKELLMVQEINVKITNSEKYKLDSYTVFEIEESIKEDISVLLAKDIDTAYKSRELIRKAIENKTVKAHEKRYELEVREIVFYTKVSIQLHIKLAD
ncbi:sporulation protein [Bacillus sp. 31A1R]|uniref:Sporulation protein n=1 Tax=Robertmurraya mangrovi TaxID=3098077 RepID=A0ABU5IZD7_9BACI|nr:sporulation membrane protein YtrI [Bacillus sp. 31A1R]MDZ5472497.1 sporulation protein [Bacillus sp. 31A1R]